MHVRAYGAGGALLAKWDGAAFFYGDLPARYEAAGAPLRWDDPAAESIKVDSDAVGASGRTLAQWAPRGTKRIVVDIVARDTGREPADGDEAAGAASGARAAPARSGWDELFDSMTARPSGAHEPGQAHGGAGRHPDLQAPGRDAGAGRRNGAGSEHGAGDGVAGSEHGAGDGVAGSEHGAGGGASSGAASSERARSGHAGGSEAASWVAGGVPGVDGGRVGDPEHGKHWGRAGGDPGAVGHVDGPGIAGVLDVPEEVAPLVNAAAIVSDANLAGLGHKLLRQAFEGAAEAVLRQQIAQEARRLARARLSHVARRLDELEKYRGLSSAQRKAVLDRAETAMAGAYRKRIAQHARAQAEANERVVAQLDGKSDGQSEHLRRIAGENARAHRQVEAAAGEPGAAPAAKPDQPAATAATSGKSAASDGAQASGLAYELNPKHTAVKRGAIGAAPRNGPAALARSVRVKATSTRRVGVDPANREIVVFDEHLPGRFHGHVRSWDELTPAMQRELERASLVDKRGRIIED